MCINSPKFTSKNRCGTDAKKIVADELCRLYGYARHVDYFTTSFPGHKVVILRETIGLDGTTRVFEPGTGIHYFAIVWCKEKIATIFTRVFTSIRVDNRFVDKCADMERFGSSQRCSFSAQYEAASAYCRARSSSRLGDFHDAVRWKLAWHWPTAHKIWTSRVTSGNLSQRFRTITGSDYFTEIEWRDF